MLGQQGLLVMLDGLGQPGIVDSRIEGDEEAEAAFDLAQQQRS